ncbi:hypothetical protein RchiOBHm_Chr4g0401081 [Rosa chinensis]|uniref:Uncharacterized protein n=1 Tax=Rosa chinensis TaxID=74649 RepID=A0A2P6QT09_ROSCH|nr:hypothetical protein RchiOBHm_Chr4g0401081 [Rosa chinensis]
MYLFEHRLVRLLQMNYLIIRVPHLFIGILLYICHDVHSFCITFFTRTCEQGTDYVSTPDFGLYTYPGRELRHHIDFKVYPPEIYAFGLKLDRE